MNKTEISLEEVLSKAGIGDLPKSVDYQCKDFELAIALVKRVNSHQHDYVIMKQDQETFERSLIWERFTGAIMDIVSIHPYKNFQTSIVDTLKGKSFAIDVDSIKTNKEARAYIVETGLASEDDIKELTITQLKKLIKERVQ